jgi:hypothetical protein
MKIKDQRWYEIIDSMAHVYDSGYKEFSVSVSIVPIAELGYYRTNFKLTKIWEQTK